MMKSSKVAMETLQLIILMQSKGANTFTSHGESHMGSALKMHSITATPQGKQHYK
jgi:hypothetical protein